MPRVFTVVPLLFLTVTLTACAGAAVIQARTQEEAEWNAQIRDELAKVSAQCNADYDKPALDPIRDNVQLHLSLTGNEPVPFNLLIIKRTPTSPEQKALIVWTDVRATCAARAREIFTVMPMPQSWPPEFQQQVRDGFIAFINQAVQATNYLTASLYDGDLTYGEFNKQRPEVLSKVGKQLNVWTSAMNAKDRARILQEAQAAQQQADAALARRCRPAALPPLVEPARKAGKCSPSPTPTGTTNNQFATDEVNGKLVELAVASTAILHQNRQGYTLTTGSGCLTIGVHLMATTPRLTDKTVAPFLNPPFLSHRR
jgi:hypothetical protein